MPQNPQDENVFLHDLATPLATVIFLVDAVLKNMQKCSAENSNEIAQLIDANKSLEKIKKMLQSRKEALTKK